MLDSFHEASSQALVDLLFREIEKDQRLKVALEAGSQLDIEAELRSFLEDELPHFPEDLTALSALVDQFFLF